MNARAAFLIWSGAFLVTLCSGSAGSAEEAQYGRLDFTRMSREQESFWQRLNLLALDEALLVHCGQPDDFERRAKDAIRSCVTKDALDKAAAFFSSHVAGYAAFYKTTGQTCGSVPLTSRAYLGVNIHLVDPAAHKNSDISGALVANAIPAGPAAVAGVTTGDVITSVNGESVSNYAELRTRLSRKLAETVRREVLKIGIVRNGAEETVNIYAPVLTFNSEGKLSFDAPAALKHDAQDLQRVVSQITNLCHKCKEAIFSLFCR